MSTLAIGIASSHGPMLNTLPEQWGSRSKADQVNPKLIYKGDEYTYDELAAERGEQYEGDCDLEVWTRRHKRSREAISELGNRIKNADLDGLVIVSSDHKEVFDDELLPQFAIYWGDDFDHVPYTEEQLESMAPGLAVAEVGNQPETALKRAGYAELAQHLIQETSTAGFEPAASRKLPPGRWDNHSIPHGWGFIFQQIYGGEDIPPTVPVFVNTFYEPNPPSAAKCIDFGHALGDAVRSFGPEKRIGLVASGGLSHMVVDESLDKMVLDAFLSGDVDSLNTLPSNVLRSGSSEIRNWLVVAAAMGTINSSAELIAYEPGYRTPAGTGCGLGFMVWDPVNNDGGE